MTGTLQPLADGNSKSGAGQTPRRWRTAWIRVERLLLVAGLALLAVYGVARVESALAARAALKEFATLDSGGIASSESGEEKIASLVDADSGEVDFKSWDKGRVQAYQKRVSDQSSTPLAVLRISKIHLEVPVLDGTDTRTLNRAVGRISGTGWPGARGNIGIAGHRDGFFRGLKDVSVGDAIELRTLKETDTYVVDRIHIVSPDDVGVLQPRPVPSLTLVTCYPFHFIGSAPQRYIVTAFLAGETKRGTENSTLGSRLATSSQKKEKQ